jgi:hypothetical protein
MKHHVSLRVNDVTLNADALRENGVGEIQKAGEKKNAPAQRSTTTYRIVMPADKTSPEARLHLISFVPIFRSLPVLVTTITAFNCAAPRTCRLTTKSSRRTGNEARSAQKPFGYDCGVEWFEDLS